MPSWVSLNPSECQDFSAINKMGCFAPHFGINLQFIIINNLYDVELQTFTRQDSAINRLYVVFICSFSELTPAAGNW